MASSELTSCDPTATPAGLSSSIKKLPEACVVLVFEYQPHFSQFCEPHSYIKLCLSRKWQTSSRDYVAYQPLAQSLPQAIHRVPLEITAGQQRMVRPSDFSLVVLQFAQTAIEKESARSGVTVRMAERRTDEIVLSASDIRARIVSAATQTRIQLKSNADKFSLTINLEESGLIWQGKWQASLYEWMSRDWTTDDDKTLAMQLLSTGKLHELCLATNHHYYKMPAVVPSLDDEDDEQLPALRVRLLATDDRLFLNNYLRSFNNSYVHMASCQQLPGCSYLRLHEPSARDRLPHEWFEFHSQWAVRRLSRSPAADAAILAALERVAEATGKKVSGASSGDDSWLNHVQEQDLVVAVEWFSELLCFVPRMHPYLKDCLDRCDDEEIKARVLRSLSSNSSITTERLAGRAQVGDIASTWWASAAAMTPKMVECAVREIRKEAAGIKKRTSASAGPLTSRETFARLARAECKSHSHAQDLQSRIQHVIENTDKFVALWGGRYPYMSADDCESMFISIFILWRQLMEARQAVRDSKLTSKQNIDEKTGSKIFICRIEASAKEFIAKGQWMWPLVHGLTDPTVAYVPVMLNCAILRSISEPVDIYTEMQRQLAQERAEHAQHCVQCWNNIAGWGGDAKTRSRHVCTGKVPSGQSRMYPFRVGDSRTSDERLVCHVMMLAIPAPRLSLWIRRGLDYRQTIEQAAQSSAVVVYTNRHGCDGRDRCQEGHGWHRLPNLTMEGTEYSVSQQHLLNSPGSGLPNSLRERDDLQVAFLQHFRATFPQSTAFQVRHPRSVTENYNLMAYAVSAHSVDMDRLHGVSEFVFIDARTRRQAVPYSDLVRSPAFQMDSLQDWIVAMPVSGSRFLPSVAQATQSSRPAPEHSAGDQKRPALEAARSQVSALGELVATVCHGEPFAAPPPVSLDSSTWNWDHADQERQQQAESKFLTMGVKEHVRLFVREIDWGCSEPAWNEWIERELKQQGRIWRITRVDASWMPVFDDFRVREIVIEISEVV